MSCCRRQSGRWLRSRCCRSRCRWPRLGSCLLAAEFSSTADAEVAMEGVRGLLWPLALVWRWLLPSAAWWYCSRDLFRLRPLLLVGGGRGQIWSFSLHFRGRIVVAVLVEQWLSVRSAAFFIFVQFSVCCYRFSFQASWLRCTMALSSFRSVVDVEAGTRVGPKGMCFSCTAAFTVLISCGQRIVWFYRIGATAVWLWIVRLDPLRVFPCVWGKVLHCFVLISLNLVCCLLFNSDGALHHVPYVAMPSAAFCIKAKKILIGWVRASCKTREIPIVTVFNRSGPAM